MKERHFRASGAAIKHLRERAGRALRTRMSSAARAFGATYELIRATRAPPHPKMSETIPLYQSTDSL
jgi:hypothetical protein